VQPYIRDAAVQLSEELTSPDPDRKAIDPINSVIAIANKEQ